MIFDLYSTVFDSKNRNSSKIKEDIEKYRYSRGYEIHYSSEIEKAKKQFPIESIDDAVKYIEANAEEADKIRWIAFCENNEEYLSALYDKITLTDLENSVVEGLQIIEPDIERLAFVSGKTGEGRHAVVKMKGNGIYPLSEMGDGINRILHIILSLVNAENGFLLIDEIENGLHYSALEQLWKVIFVLSEKLNVQVFATTHSVDCIQSFALHPDEENKNYFRLDKVDGEITVEDYSSEELKIAVQNDIETRA
jgi:AAA15 family ATPase/GTPase